MPDPEGCNRQSTKKDGDPNAERIKGYSSEKEAYKRLKQKKAPNAASEAKRSEQD